MAFRRKKEDMKYIVLSLLLCFSFTAQADLTTNADTTAPSVTLIAQCRQIVDPKVSGAACTLNNPGLIYFRKVENLGYELKQVQDWKIRFENPEKCRPMNYPFESGCVFSKENERPYSQCKEDSRYIYMKSGYGRGSTLYEITEAVFDKQTKQLRLKFKQRRFEFFWQKRSDFILQCESF